MTWKNLRPGVAGLCLGLGLVLTACPPPPAGNDGGGGTGGGSACAAGTVGCGCDNNTCSSGECVDGACVACQRGSATCVCRANGTCDQGLRCASGKCETCPAGQNGCACNGTMCSAGLTCSNGTCVPDTCSPGAVGCPCRTQGPVCDNTAYCDPTGRCQTCTPDVKGCACSSTSTCLGGLVCNMATMQCRDAVTCAQLRGADAGTGGCAPNQLCSATAGQDAVCVMGMCEPNFKFDSTTNTCVACVSANCASEPTCDVDGGIGGTCDAQNRVCNQSGNVAACGACKAGFAPNAANECKPVPRCGSTTCPLTDYCDTSSGTPTCRMLPCTPGQAKDSTGTCTQCTTPVSCSGTGYSGRYWPFRLTSGSCICETLDGYFEPGTSTSVATPCDADNDGWVNKNADSDSINMSPVLKANARCTIRKVDRVKLVDESGLTAEVHSCTNSMNLHVPVELLADGGAAPLVDGGYGGFPPVPGGANSACTVGQVFPIRLLESPRNDQQASLTSDPKVPVYGAGGRALEANELNSLTKGCITGTNDLNNLLDTTAVPAVPIDDINEVQPKTLASDDQERLKSFTYYVELYTSWYEDAPSGSLYGALVIKERSRCDLSFPLHYDPNSDGGVGEAFTTVVDGGARYWRSCERRRDPGYNAANLTATGYDFAQFTCPSTSGTCPFREFPSATQVGPTSPRSTFFRSFGRCNLGGALPADRRWRGFGHHSQFKCVQTTTGPTTGTSLNVNAFDGGLGGYVFNSCSTVQCATPNDPNCRTTTGVGPQTASPVIRCSPTYSPSAGLTGFAAVGYRPYGNQPAYNGVNAYQGGCIAEDMESEIPAGSPEASYQSYVCPFPEFSRIKALSDYAFGRHSCYTAKANFLWSGPTPQRATLRWSAPDAGNATLNGVFRN